MVRPDYFVSMGQASDDDTREAIMRATYRALCEHGYANLTTQNIADELDKSTALLHYHYDTKEDLLLAFLDRLIGWVGDRLAETDTEHPVDRLAEYVDRFVIDPDEDRRQSFALALIELRLQAVHNETFRERLVKHYRGNVDAAAEIVEAGVEAGVFRPVDPERTGEVIYTALVGARMYQVTLGADHATRAMRDELFSYVVTNLLTEEYVVGELLSGEPGA